MTTIYKIMGGGQKVQRNTQAGLPTQYIKVENSDWVEKCGCSGQDFAANTMWSTELEDLQRWANEWAGCEVTLVEAEEERM
ncbi:hypothetical protein [Phocaeicola sp.]